MSKSRECHHELVFDWSLTVAGLVPKDGIITDVFQDHVEAFVVNAKLDGDIGT
jgi:hypothetical protein